MFYPPDMSPDEMDRADTFERCQNEECERPYHPADSTANAISRFCSIECEGEDREATE